MPSRRISERIESAEDYYGDASASSAKIDDAGKATSGHGEVSLLLHRPAGAFEAANPRRIRSSPLASLDRRNFHRENADSRGCEKAAQRSAGPHSSLTTGD
jgi:hypothetical protein